LAVLCFFFELIDSDFYIASFILSIKKDVILITIYMLIEYLVHKFVLTKYIVKLTKII